MELCSNNQPEENNQLGENMEGMSQLVKYLKEKIANGNLSKLWKAQEGLK